MRLGNALIVGLMACAVSAWGADRNAQKIEPHWVATWATSQVGPEPSQPQLADAQLTDTTVRQIVHLSIGGADAAGRIVQCVWHEAAARRLRPCGKGEGARFKRD